MKGVHGGMAGSHRDTTLHESKTAKHYFFPKLPRVLFESQCNTATICCPSGFPRIRNVQNNRHAHNKFHQSNSSTVICAVELQLGSPEYINSEITFRSAWRQLKDYRGDLVGNYLHAGPRGILEYNLSGRKRELENLHVLQGHGAVTGL